MAVPTLDALCEAGFEVAIVVTRADKRRGRGSSTTPSPVKAAAQARKLLVSHSVDDVLEEHRRRPIDLGVVVAYGALIKKHVLEAIPMVNLHVSLLPRWRGAAPIERAILAGDTETGVCLMQLEEGLDTGGIIDRYHMTISETTTAEEVRARLIVEGTDLLLRHLSSGWFDVHPQEGVATVAPKISAEERRIDWNRSAVEVSRLIRIGDAWTGFRGRRMKIHAARVFQGESSGDERPGTIIESASDVVVRCGSGSLVVTIVQAEGRPRLDAMQWVRGARLVPNEGFEFGAA